LSFESYLLENGNSYSQNSVVRYNQPFHKVGLLSAVAVTGYVWTSHININIWAN